jgi:CRISPR system Cascade subunit CasA
MIAYKEDKPVRLSLEKQLWRNADCFILSVPAEKTQRPRIIDWLATLRAEELAEGLVHLRVMGFSADKAKPLGWAMEPFAVPSQYITNETLATNLKAAIAFAEAHRDVFKSFRGSPYFCLGEALKHPDVGALARALDGESRYWAALDQQFSEFLVALAEDESTDRHGIVRYGRQALPQWNDTVQKAAASAFTDSIVSIRNYRARAKGLQALGRLLRKLRGDDLDSPAQKSKGSRKAKSSAA